MSKPTVFISYSHKDIKWKEHLLKNLKVLEKQFSFEIWDDSKIKVSDDWFEKIKKSIESSSIAILLITTEFLISDFIIDKEIPILLEKKQKMGLKIMPLICEHCSWKITPWLKKIEVRPKGYTFADCTELQIEKDLVAFTNELYEILSAVPEQTNDKTTTNFPPEKIDLIKLPNISSTLFGRKKELETLDEAWENPDKRIISFIAWGGVGKSALINRWLNDMDKNSFKGAEQVYGWSFYSQGTKEKGAASSDEFFNTTLKSFGYDGEIPKTQNEKGKLLATIISEKKTLLILDGLEPLQYPPGPVYGLFKDQAMPAFLRTLVRNMNGLCIITSRCDVEDLKGTEGKLSFTHKLENLSEKAGVEVLKHYKLKGNSKEFIKTTNEFKCHALALNLIGSYLNAVHNGDLRRRDLIPKLTEDIENGGHARRVMESYEKWFSESNKAELDVLQILGLFDRPAAKGAVDVLKQKPEIPGLTDRLQNLSNKDWQYTLKHLRELHLIAEKDEFNPDTLDCHPLIREHFSEKLQNQNPNAWKEAHARLYEYYKNKPEKDLPDTLEEMEPLFAAVMHGCLAEFPTKVWEEVFWNRIYRGNEKYIIHKLGAFGTTSLSAVSNFFEIPWEKPIIGLRDSRKALVLNFAGFALRAVGRLFEAAQPMKAGLEMHIIQENWKESALDASNLSELYLTLGDVDSAQKYGEQSVNFADRSGDGFHMESKRTTHADTKHQSGKISEAEKLFIEAENMQKKRQAEYPYLFSLQGFRYCDLLLSIGKYKEVLERARTAIKIAERNNWLLDIALDKLSIGKVLMLQAIDPSTELPEMIGTGRADFSEALVLSLIEAENYLNQAVDGLREAGTQHRLPWGLLARASLFKYKKEFLNSWTDLDEAREIAEYGQMKLHLTDYHLEACRNIKEQLSEEGDQLSVIGDRLSEEGDRLSVNGDQLSVFKIIENGETLSLTNMEMKARFQEHFKKAEQLIKDTGYHRRDGELGELRIES